MYRKTLHVLTLSLLLASLLITALPAHASPPGPEYRPVDAGPRLRDLTPGEVSLHLQGPAGQSAPSGSGGEGPAFYVEGDTVFALWYDDLSGLWIMPYTVAAIGEHIEVWVAADLDFPSGDPRNPVVVTQDQIDYLVSEFDNNIYPNNTSFFGMPDFHNGSNAVLDDMLGLPPDYYMADDEADRVIAMISNIGDENYYDPTYPLYIAGFYWGSVFEYYLDRNVISIDAYDWANRVGPNDAPWRGPDPSKWREFLYEGTFAHEFQHLIHDDVDTDEELWVDEGCADFSEFLNGYGHPDSHVRDTADYPENSLVVWGDQGDLEILSDYGHAYLWTLYLYENFGGDFLQAMVANPANGISGINSTLDAFSIQQDFGELYHEWAVALLIDSKTPGGGRYEFENIDFNLDIGTPGAPNPEAFDTPGAPPWGTDYIWIDGDPKELAKFTFNGIDYTTFPTGWTSDGDVLWSGAGDLLDNWAIFEATGGGTLSFDTYWDIEDYWDFGFVQVSADGGYTWASLENAYATYLHDPSAHPKAVENLPGLTGWSGGWLTISFDLSAYAGQDILVAFRYVTDWATYYEGWYIDNVYVDSTLVSDGSDASVFKDITEVVPINNDFTVTFVGIKEKKKGNQYKVLTMKLDEITEDGLFELNSVLKSSSSAVLLVTFDAPEGFTGYADYSYGFTYTNAGPKK